MFCQGFVCVCCCLVIVSTVGFTFILRARLEAMDLWLTWQGQLLRKRRQSSWLLLYSKWVGLFYVRLGGGFKGVSMFMYFYLGMICYVLTDIFNWVVQPPSRKLVGWYHQEKRFHEINCCWRTILPVKLQVFLDLVLAWSEELYQCNPHAFSSTFVRNFQIQVQGSRIRPFGMCKTRPTLNLW